MKRRKPDLGVVYDDVWDKVKIAGIWYAGDVFREFAEDLPIDEPFIISKREGGVVVIKRHTCV